MVTNHKKDIKGFAIYVELASLGVEMFAPIAIGAVLDSYSSTKPFGIISGILCGVLVVAFHIKRRLF
jgi:F0F1-type ATP synthase assembly protein I